MESILDIIQQLWINFQQGQLPDLGSWNYALMAAFMMLQGRMSAFFGGIAAAAGYLNLGLIILIAISARVFVDYFWYRVGATGYVDRLGKRFSTYERVSARVQEGVSSRPARFILIAKLSNGLSLPAIVAAGNAKIPVRSWMPASFVGELLWTLPLLFLGYFATDSLSQIKGGMSIFTMGFTVILLIAGIVYTVKSRRERLSAG